MRKGDAIAHFLFNAVLEITIRISKKESRWNVVDKCSQIVAYADGVVIMGRRLKVAKEVFISLFGQTNKMGFLIYDTITVA